MNYHTPFSFVILTLIFISFSYVYSYGLSSRVLLLNNGLKKSNEIVDSYYRRNNLIKGGQSFKLFVQDEKKKITRDNEGDFFESEVYIKLLSL